jgi:hypothetical protein
MNVVVLQQRGMRNAMHLVRVGTYAGRIAAERGARRSAAQQDHAGHQARKILERAIDHILILHYKCLYWALSSVSDKYTAF